MTLKCEAGPRVLRSPTTSTGEAMEAATALLTETCAHTTHKGQPGLDLTGELLQCHHWEALMPQEIPLSATIGMSITHLLMSTKQDMLDTTSSMLSTGQKQIQTFQLLIMRVNDRLKIGNLVKSPVARKTFLHRLVPLQQPSILSGVNL